MNQAISPTGKALNKGEQVKTYCSEKHYVGEEIEILDNHKQVVGVAMVTSLQASDNAKYKFIVGAVVVM